MVQHYTNQCNTPFKQKIIYNGGLPWGLSGQESTCQCRNAGLIPGPGRCHVLHSKQLSLGHNHWASVLEPRSHSYWAHVPYSLCPAMREATARRSLCPAMREQPPLTATREKPAQQGRPRAAINKKQILKNIYNGRWLSHKTRSKIMPFAATWMQLEIIIVSEVNQTEKDKYHMISFICGS